MLEGEARVEQENAGNFTRWLQGTITVGIALKPKRKRRETDPSLHTQEKTDHHQGEETMPHKEMKLLEDSLDASEQDLGRS